MSRDWQKDMERVNNYKHAKTLVNVQPMFLGQTIREEPDILVLEYWLQQYAAEKEHADELEKILNGLRQALEEALKREDAYEAQEIMLYILASFFPDKEEEAK